MSVRVPAISADVRPSPRHLQIEVTGACNLACEMCLVAYRPKIGRRSGAFGLEEFQRLLAVMPDLERVTLQGLGEPLLNPQLLEMVRAVRARGARVGFNSNGMLLTEARARDLIEAGTSWLHISLDGATAESYEAIRHGARFERVRSNLRRLLELRDELGSATPRIEVVFVAMRRNVHELPALVEWCADARADELWVQNLSHDFSDAGRDYDGLRDYVSREALTGGPDEQAVFRSARELADGARLKLRLPELEPPGERAGGRGDLPCSWPFEETYVTHRGDVEPCCMVMGSDRATMGNIRTQPFEEVWAGEAYRDFRARLLSDDPPDVCTGCSLYRGRF
jgi:radical SAM protein with 4Fe4S-binding SPASM domain